MLWKRLRTDIQLMPRRRIDRFRFIIPNDIQALVLHMLEQAKHRPSIKEILASPLFKSVQEGEYEQQQHAKQRALQKVDELQCEKKQAEKQICKLHDQLKRLQQYNAAQADAPKLPKIKTVDIAVGTESEDEISAAKRKCNNLEQIVAENEKTIADCFANIELLEDKLEKEFSARSEQEKEFADVKAKLEDGIQLERNSRASALAKLHQTNEINTSLQKTIQETEACHKVELQKADAEIKALQAQLAAINQQPIRQLPKPQQQQQQQVQQEIQPNTSDLLAEFTGLSEFLGAHVPTETPKRTINEAAGAIATKRQRTGPDFQHLTLVQYQSLVAINTTKLPNAEAAWIALDWAYGLYEKNAGDISNPPDALKQVLTNHTKEAVGCQRTSPFEEWLMLVLQQLGVEKQTLNKRNIFQKLTGRSGNAYATLLKRYKK